MFSSKELGNETSAVIPLTGWRFLKTQSSTIILAYLFLAVFVITNWLVNLRVIYVTCTGLQMRNMSLRSLIIQASVISISLTIYLAGEQVGFLKHLNHLSCGVINFVKTVLLCAVSTNMVAIFYNQVTNFDGYTASRSQLSCRTILRIWIPALLQGLPDYFLVASKNDFEEYSKSSSVTNCVPVVFSGSVIFFGLIELFKFLFFNIVFLIYMIKVLISLHSKLRYRIGRIPNARQRLQNQISTTRFLCLQLIAFTIFMVPLKLVFLITRITELVTFSQEENSSSNSLYTNIIVFTYLSLNSSINLTHVQNNMGIWPVWCYCWCICLPQRTFRDNNLQRAYADIILPSMVRPGPRREEGCVASSSSHSTGVMSAHDISSATSRMSHGTRMQATVSMINIVDRSRETSESRESSCGKDASEKSVGMLKETMV